MTTSSQPSAGRTGPRLDAARLGKRVTVALYFALVVHVVGVGFVSVVPQVFWPERSASPSDLRAEGPAGCRVALVALQAELMEQTARDTAAEAPRAPHAWLEGWDARYRSLASPCGDVAGYSLLARLRYAVEEHLSRFEAEVAPRASESRRALEAEGH